MTEKQNQYRVLARKYRPTNFDELIGQEALVQTLHNALSMGRLAHAFVLTGLRGIGKTTTARIIAKGLNCIGEDGDGQPTLNPCGKCPNCEQINKGRHVDVIEMDAASNTSVDDVREIIDSVSYKPLNARYKIYIIDEVHMLSKNAFNALLKTLEEPPESVKFIFATTEIRKVPVTVLSRCQRFDLRRIPQKMMVDYLEKIANAENIKSNTEALEMIARAAEGSVRDALSILDQAAALTADDLDALQVAKMLGKTGRQQAIEIIKSALGGDASAAIEKLEQAIGQGAEPMMVIADMLDIIHSATMIAAGGHNDNATENEKNIIQEIANEKGMGRLVRAWQITLKGHSEMGFAPNQQAAADMIIIRLAYAENMPTPAELVRKIDALQGATATKETEAPAEKETAVKEESLAQMPSAQTPPPQPLQGVQGVQKMPTLLGLEGAVKMFEDKGEVILASVIKLQMRPIVFESGRFEFSADKVIDGAVIAKITHGLNEWSGGKWVVEQRENMGDGDGGETVYETGKAAERAVEDRVKKHPVVAEVLSVFPDAKIVSITPDKNEQDDENGAPEWDEKIAL